MLTMSPDTQPNRRAARSTPIKPVTEFPPYAEPPKGSARRMLNAIKLDRTFQEIQGNRRVAPFEIRQSLDPDAAGARIEAYTNRWLFLLEGARNTLIVVPLMLTWLS